MGKNILYVSWDGPQINYLESLFLPIFKELEAFGFVFHVLQFTWGCKERRKSIKSCFENNKINYYKIRVMRGPFKIGIIFTLIIGIIKINKLIFSLSINILMPRSTFPSIMTLFIRNKNSNFKILFDSDGLPADERVDFHGWNPKGFLYRVFRDLEALVLRNADAVITRSSKGSQILISRVGSQVDESKFFVVGNGRDVNKYGSSILKKSSIKENLGIDNKDNIIVFVGSSIKGKYLGHKIVEFFKYVHNIDKNSHLLLLINTPKEIDELLISGEVINSKIHVKCVHPDDVPNYLIECSLGLVFIDPSFSMKAVSAIKLGEYLLSGLPVITTNGIGDSSEIISEKIGLCLYSLDRLSLTGAAAWYISKVLPNINNYRVAARQVGINNFSLNKTILSYYKALDSIATVGVKNEG